MHADRWWKATGRPVPALYWSQTHPAELVMRSLLTVVLGVVLSLGVQAQGLETDDINLEVGHVDVKTGVRVTKVVHSPDEGLREVHLSLPRYTDDIETVVVRAKNLQRQTVVQRRPYELVDDYDNDRYGLILYLDEDHELPLRLYLDARQQRP
jgi:hypothetical protein